jgi:23S rRNA (uracil1939-C5)-methyltransferase
MLIIVDNIKQNQTQSSKIVQVSIKGLGHKAFIGKVLSGEDAGKAVFLEEVAPGEECEVEIINDAKKFAEGKLIKILKASPDRVEPVCEYFDLCGGCSLQHIDLHSQRQLKVELVTDTFTKKAKIIPEFGFEHLTSHLPGFNYRNRLRLHVSTAGQLAFYQKNSHAYVNIKECSIAKPEINAHLKNFPTFNQAQQKLISAVEFVLNPESSEVCVVFYLQYLISIQKIKNEFDSILSEFKAWKFIFGHEVVSESLSDLSQAAGSFSQVNVDANLILQKVVRENINNSKLTELYAGSGNFSFDLLQNKPNLSITAVESAKSLVEYGKKQAQSSGFSKRIEFIQARAETFVKRSRFAESLLLDPPRAGAKEALQHINKNNKPQEIVYVSCYLPTLLRDLEFLVTQDYKLQKVYVLDMFPQTYHVELVAVLKLK